MLMSDLQTNNAIKSTENISIGICLSLTGGFLDSYSYLLKGNVFANAQTGNAVLLFIALTNREFTKCIKYLIPIATFAFGILISERIKVSKRFRNHKRIKVTLLIEALMIIIIAILGKHISDYLVNCLITLIAAIQVANFDKIDSKPIATTMITGNLKSSMIHLSKYISTKERKNLSSFYQYFIVIMSFCIGVTIGSVVIGILSEYSILVCELFIIISYVIIRREEKLTTAST